MIVETKEGSGRKKPEEEQRKNWEDWWRGVTQLESPPVTPKTKFPTKTKTEKEEKKEKLTLRKSSLRSIEKKKGRKKADGKKQLSIKDMILSIERKNGGQDPAEGSAKEDGIVRKL